MKPHSQKFVQKRKFYVMLPVLVIPFLTMFFWALGGGQGVVIAKDNNAIGLNLNLPEARFSNEANAWDKLSLYQKARRDSMKANQAKKNDPYFRLSTLKVKQDTSKRDSLKRKGFVNTSLGERTEPIDETEAKVYKKLEELQKQIDKPTHASTAKASGKKSKDKTKSHSEFESDVDRLESMMLMMQDGQQEDQEMQEINTVLNKILDIQHPDRVKNRLQQANPDAPGLYADSKSSIDAVSYLGTDATNENGYHTNGFYGLEDIAIPLMEHNAIKAEVYGNQTLVSGAVIKLVLLQDISLSAVTIPKSTFVFGQCSLNGERLTVDINSIHFNNSIYPVGLSLYDVDGLEGIYVPGAIARDAAKKSSNQALQDVQLNSLDPSLEVQAASAGIEAAKGMLTKKTRLIQVTAKAGYKVFLVNKNTKSQNR
jgi:conjugative transposon TraM protein